MTSVLKQTEKILTSRFFGLNLLGIICWFFAVWLLGVNSILDERTEPQFNAVLFTFVTSLLFVWAVINEFSDLLLPVKSRFIAARLICWLLIPAAVVILTAANGILKLGIDKLGTRFSAYPLIFQMYLILILYETASYTRNKLIKTPKYQKLKKAVVFISVRVLIVLNIWFCASFVLTWLQLNRYLVSN